MVNLNKPVWARVSVVSLTDSEAEEAHFAAVAGVLVLGFPRTFFGRVHSRS